MTTISRVITYTNFTRKTDIPLIRAISVFRVKFNVEFTRQAVNFSIKLHFMLKFSWET